MAVDSPENSQRTSIPWREGIPAAERRHNLALAACGESDGSGENGGLPPFSRQCCIEDTQLTVKRKRLSVPIFGSAISATGR